MCFCFIEKAKRGKRGRKKKESKEMEERKETKRGKRGQNFKMENELLFIIMVQFICKIFF